MHDEQPVDAASLAEPAAPLHAGVSDGCVEQRVVLLQDRAELGPLAAEGRVLCVALQDRRPLARVLHGHALKYCLSRCGDELVNLEEALGPDSDSDSSFCFKFFF